MLQPGQETPQSYQPPTTNHQPPTTNHQPPTTNHQPPTTNHQPATKGKKSALIGEGRPREPDTISTSQAIVVVSKFFLLRHQGTA
jgi:hypothetical protein